MKKIFTVILVLLTLTGQVGATIKVHTIGDSTMANYDENTTDKRGWCQFLQAFFDGDFVTINNRGKSGADTRQFYTTANLWPSVKGQMTSDQKNYYTNGHLIVAIGYEISFLLNGEERNLGQRLKERYPFYRR